MALNRCPNLTQRLRHCHRQLPSPRAHNKPTNLSGCLRQHPPGKRLPHLNGGGAKRGLATALQARSLRGVHRKEGCEPFGSGVLRFQRGMVRRNPEQKGFENRVLLEGGNREYLREAH